MLNFSFEGIPENHPLHRMIADYRALPEVQQRRRLRAEIRTREREVRASLPRSLRKRMYTSDFIGQQYRLGLAGPLRGRTLSPTEEVAVGQRYGAWLERAIVTRATRQRGTWVAAVAPILTVLTGGLALPALFAAGLDIASTVATARRGRPLL